MEITLENIVIVNGRILIEHVKDNIYQVIKVAKNMNFQGDSKTIKPLDYVVLLSSYHPKIAIEERTFYIVRPNIISAYIKV